MKIPNLELNHKSPTLRIYRFGYQVADYNVQKVTELKPNMPTFRVLYFVFRAAGFRLVGPEVGCPEKPQYWCQQFFERDLLRMRCSSVDVTL